MVNLTQSANSRARSLIRRETVMDFYRSACTSYAEKRYPTFETNMQTLITKIGLIMAEVTENYVEKPDTCYASVKFLCFKVLYNPKIYNAFIDAGLNDKGNEQKHDLPAFSNINMVKVVNAYNTLLRQILSTYNLPSLKSLLIPLNPRKRTNNSANGETKVEPWKKRIDYFNTMYGYNKSDSAQMPSKPVTAFNDSKTYYSHYRDDDFLIDVKLEKNKGRYDQGLFVKKEKVNFDLKVELYTFNYNGYKIKSVTAYIQNGNNEKIKKLSTHDSVTNFDLLASEFGGKTTAYVKITYSIGFMKSRTLTLYDTIYV